MMGMPRRTSKRPWGAIVWGVALLSGPAGPARGETFVVSNLEDAGPGSLRDAIETANLSPEADAILFDSSLEGTIGLTSGPLEIADDLRIEGPGADGLTVSRTVTESCFGIFLVRPEVAASISGLTISGGHALYGGGFQNLGTLSIEDCAISNNFAEGWPFDDRWTAAGGGGIYNGGELSVARSTISGNDSWGGGGGISHEAGTLAVIDSTVSGNRATFTGGGIRCFATAVVLHSTVTDNTAWSGGGIIDYAQISDGFGLWPIWGALEMRNTILAGNHTGYDPALFTGTAPDLFGFLWGSGYNLVGDARGTLDSGGFVETDLVGGLYIGIVKKKPQYTAPVDPRLGPLANNGGSTATHALYTGSPAIDAGDPSFAQPPDTDQRGEGFPRVTGGRLDIGAFEGAIEPPSKRPRKK